jgi:hypothetical protein
MDFAFAWLRMANPRAETGRVGQPRRNRAAVLLSVARYALMTVGASSSNVPEILFAERVVPQQNLERNAGM